MEPPDGNDSDMDLIFPSRIYNNSHTTLHLKCWDRHNVLIKSNLSKNSDYFIGYTRNQTITPIKYYRLTSESKRFWVEFYSSQEYTRPSIFPVDYRAERYVDSEGEIKTRYIPYYLDDVFIEAVFCYTSSAML
jgi:hypothetical protein